MNIYAHVVNTAPCERWGTAKPLFRCLVTATSSGEIEFGEVEVGDFSSRRAAALKILSEDANSEASRN
jgi:hypothetical protein